MIQDLRIQDAEGDGQVNVRGRWTTRQKMCALAEITIGGAYLLGV
jgi:hypothetical protein